MAVEIRNWVATYYDKDNNEIGNEFFQDRSEDEASREAIGLMPSNCDDWSLEGVMLLK